ncbi:MAG: gas vesicle protein [Cyanobacteria bacterium P01_D01_bin.156]
MSQSSNFTSGFFLGALFGGLVGGIAGALATNRVVSHTDSDSDFSQLSEELKQNLAHMSNDERMEIARRGLEDKISELNAAIEDVRQQLGNTNGRAAEYEASAQDS